MLCAQFVEEATIVGQRRKPIAGVEEHRAFQATDRRDEVLALPVDIAQQSQTGRFADLVPQFDEMLRCIVEATFRLDRPAENKKLTILPAAPLLAETIRRLHEERSLTDLFVV